MTDGKKVILVIDDDPDFLDSIKMVLEGNDYAVSAAASAAAGLQAYKAGDVDMVIVDLMMEEIDSGTQFVKDLQALGNNAPIFMLSSVGNAMVDSVDYSGLGLSGVLQKPVDTDALLATLKAKLA